MGASNDQIGPIQDAVLEGRSLVPFSLNHDGNCWCFVTSDAASDGEYPVACCDTQTQRVVGEMPSFEAWLALLIREQDEVIRVLGFADELGLG